MTHSNLFWNCWIKGGLWPDSDWHEKHRMWKGAEGFKLYWNAMVQIRRWCLPIKDLMRFLTQCDPSPGFSITGVMMAMSWQTDRVLSAGVMICRVDTWPSVIMPSNIVQHDHMRDRSQVADTQPGSQDHNSPTCGHSQLSAVALISPLYSLPLSYPSCIQYYI